jgi:hypothetical protein
MEIGWKTNFLELHNRWEKVRGISIVKTGSKITIRADSNINDFSFQTARPLEANSIVSSSEEMNIANLDEISPNADLVFYEKD